MIYFLFQTYESGTAVTNRAIAYAKALSLHNCAATFVFLYPNKQKEKFDSSIPYIQFRYWWNKASTIHSATRWIWAKLKLKLFVNSLKKGDSVYLYNNSELIDFFTRIDGVKVFHERTEHPEVHTFLSTRFKKITLDNYYDSCKRLDGMFVISTALKNLFIAKGVEPNKIEIVNVIVDAKRFEGLKKQQTERYICYCGTASNNKDGVDELLKAFAILHQQYNEIKLYIAGKTPSQDDEAQNLQLIKNLGIESNVVFTGLVSPDKMPQLLKNAMMVVLDRPDSLQAQCGFPTKLGEYLLSENPVVVTKVGDIPLFLTDGYDALLAEERNPQEFASKMIWVVEHPKEAAIIGKNGAQTAQCQFNNIIETQKIIDFIKR